MLVLSLGILVIRLLSNGVVMRIALLLLMCATVALPVLFRRSRALRLLGIVTLLGTAELAWMGVQTSARIATENGHVATEGPDNPFVQGALAARDAALDMKPVFWGAVLGLAMLAVVPLRPRT